MVAVFENNGNIDIPVPQILMESVSNAAVGVTTLEVLQAGLFTLVFEVSEDQFLDNLRPGGVVTKKFYSSLPFTNTGSTDFKYQMTVQQ